MNGYRSHKLSWCVPVAFALAAPAMLTSCGGDVAAAVAFVGAVGGDFVSDDDAVAPGVQQTRCGGGACVITINPQVAPQDPFAVAFDVRYDNATGAPECAATGNGRIDGRDVRLTGCISGEFVNINQILASDGRRWYRNASVDLVPGIWQDVPTGQRRFKFRVDDAGDPDRLFTGCELTTPTRVAEAVVRKSDVRTPGGALDTVISRFEVTGGGAAWTGRFDGISRLTLQRGAEVLELERKPGDAPC